MNIWDEYKWKFWDRNNEPLSKKPKIFHKISICTTCMDRLYDLRVTLPKNIEDSSSYPNMEFVLLDYNSKDGLGDWVKSDMMRYIESGILVYYRTEEPEHYTMSHSRNVAFKLATGRIVNSVDADNFINKGFAETLNKMAEICPEKAVFAKGKRSMHGRIGFYKDEFLNLGGYDEDLLGYGFDDHNLLYRAMALGYKMMWWGGDYCSRIKTPRKDVTLNMKHKSWRETEKINKEITFKKLKNQEFIANINTHWGKAKVIKNFRETIMV